MSAQKQASCGEGILVLAAEDRTLNNAAHYRATRTALMSGGISN